MPRRVAGGGVRMSRAGLCASVVLVLVAAALPSPRSGAALLAPCDSPGNAIVAENCLAGSPASDWDVGTTGDPSIQGFSTQYSMNHGDTVHFKIKTDASAYHMDIYRIGYYGGDGARYITTVLPSVPLPQIQPSCLSDSSSGLLDCGNWAESASWSVPSTAVSGFYVAKLVREDTGGASHVPFVVRDDASHSDLLFQTSDETWQAYNPYGGGSSLYSGGPGTNPNRAYKVSYNRPFATRRIGARTYFFSEEYPMVRWLEANGYDVSYIGGVDVDQAPASLLEQHSTFLSVGHDEYWSDGQRRTVEAARDAGVNLAFFSGNEMFWKTRWESSIDGTNTSHRTLVCYKETHANAKIDPSPTWTGTWRDPRFSPPADGDRPENALSGTMSTVDDETTAIQVPGENARLRFWRNASVASTPVGSTATLAPNTLGYEWDEDLDNGARPAGEIDLSSTTVSVPERLVDYGSTYKPGIATHSLTLYRRGDALVFSAGTIQWSWGLDGVHDFGSTPDPSMKQATVNLLADMGVQPQSLQPGLTPAAPSTDATPPSATITSPTDGATVPEGQLTVSGTAQDAGGGRVAGVEVTTDGGTSWHPAAGRDNWSYSFTPRTGTYSIAARTTDDSVNTGAPSAAVSLLVVPKTAVLVPVPGAAVRGAAVLDANASPSTTRVEFRVSGGALNDTPVGTGTLTAYGWLSSWNTTSVGNGTYTLSSVAFDGAGRSGRSTPVSLTVDNTPPTTRILVPAAGAFLRGNAVLDASASDDVNVAKVEFRVSGGALNDALVGTGTLTAYGWLSSWNTTSVANGTYTLSNVAYDTAGNLTRSSPVSVTVDNTAPTTARPRSGGRRERRRQRGP